VGEKKCIRAPSSSFLKGGKREGGLYRPFQGEGEKKKLAKRDKI